MEVTTLGLPQRRVTLVLLPILPQGVCPSRTPGGVTLPGHHSLLPPPHAEAARAQLWHQPMAHRAMLLRPWHGKAARGGLPGTKPTSRVQKPEPCMSFSAFGFTAHILKLLPRGQNSLKYAGLQISLKTGQCLSPEDKSPLPPQIVLIALQPDLCVPGLEDQPGWEGL